MENTNMIFLIVILLGFIIKYKIININFDFFKWGFKWEKDKSIIKEHKKSNNPILNNNNYALLDSLNEMNNYSYNDFISK